MTLGRLHTARLLLDRPVAADLDLYCRFYGDADASRFYGGPLRRDQAWGRLAQDIGHWQLRGFGLWVVRRVADGEPLGGCGFWHPEGWPRAELTWWLVPEARKRGYATEASRAAIRFAYRTLGWSEVCTYFIDTNEPAKQLVVRLNGTPTTRATFPDCIDRTVWLLPDDQPAAASS